MTSFVLDILLGVLVEAVLYDQAVVGSIPGGGVIRAPRSTQPSIPRG